MSRSGYIEDFDDPWATICWRGAVKSAIRGKRGQAFLKEMLVALDALPDMYVNDEEAHPKWDAPRGESMTDERRFEYVRNWIKQNIQYQSLQHNIKEISHD